MRRYLPCRRPARFASESRKPHISAFAAFMVAVAAAAVGFGVAAPRAGATCNEGGVFWAMNPYQGDFLIEQGAQNTITLNQRGLNTCIGQDTGTYGTGQTSRILLDGIFGWWTEVGYGETWCSSGAQQHCWSAFTENGFNRNRQSHQQVGEGCLTPPSSETWRLDFYVNSQGQARARGWLDCSNTGNFIQVNGDLDSFGYLFGYAEGEGFYRESSDMGESHTNMKYFDGSNWQPANGVACRYDPPTSDPTHQPYPWDGSALGSTGFQLVRANNQTCNISH